MIQRDQVVGTGAIGAYYTWRIQQSGNCTITAVCRSNYDAVKSKGIEIQTTAWGDGPHVFKPDQVVKTVPSETYDYIVVCMKALPEVYSIPDIIAPAVDASPNATIVLIQNGIGIEDPVKARFPRNPVISTIAYIGVTQNELGVVYHSGPIQRLVLGLFEPIDGVDTATAVKLFGERCSLGGIETVVSDDIQNYRWQKLVWNGSMNAVSILSELWTVSNVLADDKYRAMAHATMTEIAALAEALGYPMPPTLVQMSMSTSERLAPGYKASMVVDLEAGRPLETEVILSNPIKIAESRNLLHVIPTWYKLHNDLPDHKELVLIESGIRMHTTLYLRDKSITPSGFCIKLRKHLRTRRLTNVRQLGSDRIVDYEFGADDLSNTYHVIAEFYAAGNLILTDGHYRILSILRVVQPNEKVKMAVGEIYDISALTRNFEPISKEKLIKVLTSAGPKDVLKKIINTSFDYGPALSEHAIIKADLASNLNVSSEFDISDGSPHLEALFASLQDADRIIEGKGSLQKKGYIILQQHKKKNPEDNEEQELVTYDEFHPYLFAQHQDKPMKDFESFDAAVDEFFSAIESQRLEIKRRSQEEHAQKKLDTVKMEHLGRVKGLEEAQQKNVLQAELIEANLEMCDQAIMIIRNAIATGMDWKDLADLVEEEKKHGNPIALMIDTLKLESNHICVILSDPYDDEDSEESEQDEDQEVEDRDQPKPRATVLVDLDIYLTAFANARNYYDVKKQSAIKHEKTLAHASKAFKSAEKKIRQDLQEVKITTSIQRVRKPYWFEKFMWFITSENYLVIAGRDMQQNELIVKRYMKKDDIYVHADIHGAATVLIKNPSDKEPVPPSSLYQAGIMSVCQSKAWDAKIVTSAFWVRADQVSKSAPTGEYLTTGSFMIRGKKNFLPPVQLVYGFGFLFKLDESSIGNHLNERRAPRIEDAEGTGEGTAEASRENSRKSNVENEIETAETEESASTAKPTVDEEDGQKINKSADAEDGHEDLENSEESCDESEGRSISTGGQEADRSADQDSKDIEDDNDESGSDDESQAAESSDEEFPDTQIQFASSASSNRTTKEQTNKATTNPVDKYALQDYGDDSNDEADRDDTVSLASSDRSHQQKSAYITAKMRRDMKKGKAPSTGDQDSDDKPKETKSAVTAAAVTKKSQQGNQKKADASPVPAAPVRGKKGKAKKIKEKYADQDEEERQLRLELLAPDKGPQLKGKRAKKEAEKKAEKAALAEKRRLQQEEYQKTHGGAGGGGGNANKGKGSGRNQRPEDWGKPEGEFKGRKPPRAQPTATSGGVVKEEEEEEEEEEGLDVEQAVLDAGTNEEDKEEVQRLLQEENIKMLEPEDFESLTVLDGLTGKPIPSDILQFAVPVCAPYGSLQKFKYKVKLIPGTMKKGKAVKTAVNHFLMNVNTSTGSGSTTASASASTNKENKDAEAALETRERELIKMVKDEEMINAMLGKVKISAPGVEASKKKGGGGGGAKGGKGRK
ncbi:hypothetical protein BG004_006345 [Podila humilis]|nr:hypothetical protein BG004_006345 [Podila humilis]